jgi:hypothetical protein
LEFTKEIQWWRHPTETQWKIIEVDEFTDKNYRTCGKYSYKEGYLEMQARKIHSTIPKESTASQKELKDIYMRK